MNYQRSSIAAIPIGRRSISMKLYLIHCGFYDEAIARGIYEFHVNLPILATSLEEAKARVRKNEEFQKRKMHIDGIQELNFVDGYEVVLQKSEKSTALTNQSHPYRKL